jgi:dephospho-CoA kinase
VHDVPLLVESTRGYDYGAVIVVEAPRAVRLRRLESRGVPRADAEARMAAQATDEERRAVATWVVDNGGDLA